MNRLLVLLSVSALCLAGCDAPKREVSEQDKALQKAIEAPQDKARAVEEQLKKDTARKREEIDAQGG